VSANQPLLKHAPGNWQKMTLGAAFFFTVKEHRNPLRLFTTIAYQLTTTLPDYRGAIEDRIFKDNTIVEKKMSSQLKLLSRFKS